MRLAQAVLPVALAALLVGCPAPEPDVAAPSLDEPVEEPSVAVPGGVAGDTRECTNPEIGYTIRYPAGWETNDGEVMPPCSLFDPEPITIDPATEIPADIAVAIRLEEVAIDQVSQVGPGQAELSRSEAMIGGRPAARLETQLTEDLLRPAGTRVYRVLVDMNGETLIAETTDIGEPPYAESRRALDDMMDAIRFE